jgi:hypothetical protein
MKKGLRIVLDRKRLHILTLFVYLVKILHGQINDVVLLQLNHAYFTRVWLQTVVDDEVRFNISSSKTWVQLCISMPIVF